MAQGAIKNSPMGKEAFNFLWIHLPFQRIKHKLITLKQVAKN
jgi:hypothetical protein